MFKANGLSVTVAARAIVPDDPASIAARVTEWCDVQKVCFFGGERPCVHTRVTIDQSNSHPPTMVIQLDAVFTSGGTGFAPRDLTPEAVKPLLDKEAPGVVYRIMEVRTYERRRGQRGPVRS